MKCQRARKKLEMIKILDSRNNDPQASPAPHPNQMASQQINPQKHSRITLTDRTPKEESKYRQIQKRDRPKEKK